SGHERVALAAVVPPARGQALARVAIKLLLPTWRLRIVIVALGRHCRTGPAIAPQRTGQRWPIAWRRFRRQLAGPDYDRPQHSFWGRAGAKQRHHDALHLLLDP